MKYKRLFALIVLAMLVISINGCYYNPFKTEHQKVREMQFAGEYTDTLIPLGKLLKQNPKDIEAHRLLGVSNLNLYNLDTAEINFFNAVFEEKNQEKKIQMRNEIAREYKKIFLFYLGKVDNVNRKKTEKLFMAILNLNPEQSFLAKLKEYLEDEGNSKLSKNSLAIADSHFSYLFRLDQSSKQRVGQIYLTLFNQTADAEFKIIVIDRAFEISKEQNIKKAHFKHHCELSQQAQTTEEAITELEIADKSGNCKSELKTMYAKFKQEQMQGRVDELSQKKGKPDIDEVMTSKKNPITIFENPKLNDGFIYLASSNFIGFDDAGPAEYPSALKNPKTVEYTGYKYINGALKIRKKDNNVRVVIWKLNSS